MRRSCHSNGSERTYHSRRAQSIGVVAATVVQGGGAGSQCDTRQLRGSDWGRVAAVRRTEGVVARGLGLEQLNVGGVLEQRARLVTTTIPQVARCQHTQYENRYRSRIQFLSF